MIRTILVPLAEEHTSELLLDAALSLANQDLAVLGLGTEPCGEVAHRADRGVVVREESRER